MLEPAQKQGGLAYLATKRSFATAADCIDSGIVRGFVALEEERLSDSSAVEGLGLGTQSSGIGDLRVLGYVAAYRFAVVVDSEHLGSLYTAAGGELDRNLSAVVRRGLAAAVLEEAVEVEAVDLEHRPPSRKYCHIAVDQDENYCRP